MPYKCWKSHSKGKAQGVNLLDPSKIIYARLNGIDIVLIESLHLSQFDRKGIESVVLFSSTMTDEMLM